MRVRLTVKLAEVVEGVDLSGACEGDVIGVSERDGQLLIAGGWAEGAPDSGTSALETRHAANVPHSHDVAPDSGNRKD